MGIEIAAIVTAAVEAIASITVAQVISAIAVAVVSAAVSYGIQSAFASSPKSSASSVAQSDRTQQVRQPITSHRIAVGRLKLSGPIVFLHSNDAEVTRTSQVTGAAVVTFKKYDLLFTAVVLAAHPIDGVEAIFIDDTQLTGDTYGGFAWVEPMLGSSDQGASPFLMNECDGKWTAADRLRGRAYLASGFYWNTDKWSGVPNVSALIHGLNAIYDPRLGTTGYSNNPALFAAWYLTSEHGLRCDWDELDLDALIGAANVCDEEIPLKAGGTEPRYRINGTIDLDQAPQTILEDIATCMAGWIVQTGGKWTIHAGAWEEPTLGITEDHLRGPVSVQANRSARDLFNCVRATYIRGDGDWQATDAPVLYDAAAIAADSGIKYYTDLDYPLVTSGTQVQRLMLIALRKNRHQRVVALQLNLSGLRLRAGMVVTFSTPRLPLATYRITKWALAADAMGVDVTLEHETASVWGWNAATDEQGLDVTATPSLPNTLYSSAPVVWLDLPSDPVPATVQMHISAVQGATGYEAQWRTLVGNADWVDVPTSGQNAAPGVPLPAEFRGRGVVGGSPGEWGFLPVGPEVASLTARSDPGSIALAWSAPGALGVQIFMATSNSFAQAVLQTSNPGTDGTLTVMPPTGEVRFFWARAFNAGANPGYLFGPVSAEATPVGTGGGEG